MTDANYLVWRQGVIGAYPSLDLFDPRASSEWKVRRQSTLAIMTLTAADRALSFAEIVARYPCPKEKQIFDD